MKSLKFEWDERKNNANVKKHGVSFNDARTAFYDENALLFLDPDNSESEDRFILLGINHRLNTLVVCHCFKENEGIVRIISARRANKVEMNAYWSLRK